MRRLLAVLAILAAAASTAGTATAARTAACRSTRTDAPGRALARTAQTTVETYATDHEGSYSGLSRRILHEYEPTITVSRTEAEREHEAWLVAVWALQHGEGYALISRAPNGNDFEIVREPSGNIQRFARLCGRITTW